MDVLSKKHANVKQLYAECRQPECRGAESRGASSNIRNILSREYVDNKILHSLKKKFIKILIFFK
jgi:hypothetical protein